MPRLDEAHLHMDSLISEGVRRGANAALTSVGSYYGDVNFDAVGRGGPRVISSPLVAPLLEVWRSSQVRCRCHRSSLVLGF